MGSKYMECRVRDFPGAPRCTTTLVADNDMELLEAVVKHGINVHGSANTGAFRDQVRKEFKDGSPPA